MYLRIRLCFATLIVLSLQNLYADSISNIYLEEVIIKDSFSDTKKKSSVQTVDIIGQNYIQKRFSGNLVNSIEDLPGVNSMDIGSGFSKPMIRGMAFNRIAVIENNIKQEGQQWGADHGLEIDALNVENVTVRKGPAALLYGSDAMGGVIEITEKVMPVEDIFFGELYAVAKSVNESFGGSLMLGIKKNNWYSQLRYTEHRFGDYKIPTDTIVYLTQKIPVYNRRLKNTAGKENNISWLLKYRKSRLSWQLQISDVYQKTGFFPGAHGIPDISRVEDDGDTRNIGYPYSFVNHLKAIVNGKYSFDNLIFSADISYQNNLRREISMFHTHYPTQTAPEKDPDKELEFRLDTYQGVFKSILLTGDNIKHTIGVDAQIQNNSIAGYSFLLPEYRRFTLGGFMLGEYKLSSRLNIQGGIRYDLGKIDADSYEDSHLYEYLISQGYASADLERYKMRSYEIDRLYKAFSGAIGMAWNPSRQHSLKLNIGRSFRLPGVNELASNGVHHGTFRHEQGDPDLKPESGWQFDISYDYSGEYLSFGVSPFVSRYSNYIYLRPTGEWSVLPHAGQIYRYTGCRAMLAGGEVSASVRLPFNFSYSLAGDYVYTRNEDENLPLAFSPQPSLRQTVSFDTKRMNMYIQSHLIAGQRRIARNEDITKGASLWHAGFSYELPSEKFPAELILTVKNIFNVRYYNHLSFYRKMEIPEPGRSFNLMVKIPFKTKI